MKKVLSILLLLVFLFNVGGYYIVFWGLRLQTDQQFNHRLDADLYDPEETIKLQIPVTLPYPFESREFHRVQGMFEHNGEFFRLVKQKLQNDTLYVVCIRDRVTRDLVEAMTDYIQLTQVDRASDNNKKALTYISKLVKDFCPQQVLTLADRLGFLVIMQFAESPNFFIEIAVPVHAPPPKA